FTAKDFRTWAGTVQAACVLADIGPAGTEAESKRNIREAIATVAELLGNTPTICRKCYVHPDVLEAYADGSLTEVARVTKRSRESSKTSASPLVEAAVLACLEARSAGNGGRSANSGIVSSSSSRKTPSGSKTA
ncbi:MAG TPA: hypothetical protein VMM78_00390, partial [Thermomicrobiales bacterium]|nr:hypothetical protein [Thermomicrobiales bacterium]